MSNKTKRGGLGRGLGALIPTAAPQPATEPTEPTEPTVGVPVGGSGPATESVPEPETSTPRDPGAAAPTGSEPDGSAPDGDLSSTGSGEKTPDGDDDGDRAGVRFLEVPIAAVHPNAKQPRQVFDEDALAELTHSVREFGVLQPIVVREDSAGYELVMGERRLRAATAAGLSTVPAIVRATADDAMLRDALLENIHRAQLNPLEEAAAYQQLLQEFGATHDELAQRIGRSRPQVSNTIRLLNLSIPVQRRVAAGVLSAGHARALLSLDDTDQQDEIAARIVAEGLSVRATEELVTLTLRGHLAPRPARHAPTPRISAPAVAQLAEQLSDLFDTRVRVELGRRKGKITVEFGSVNDLERLVAMMAPGLGDRSGPEPVADAEH